MLFNVKMASFIFGVLVFFLESQIQGQSLRNSSWVALGNAVYTLPDQGISFQQSIGQSSVTGIFSSQAIRASQGFLQGIRVGSAEIIHPFEVIAFPNSFSERITFRFTTDHQEVTQVRIHDAQGKLVYESTQHPTTREILLHLPFLSSGIYVANLSSGNKFVQLRLIKKL
ncbi:MAG: T9SS type A sorting domain-containing protein [Algoriphagus sp.]|nr:T9SS type A sorting domain-containing protein [Algoriphagus sp.]